MAGCEIYSMLLALVICRVSANYERLENSSYFDVSRIPWKSNNRYDVSELLHHYNNSYKSSKDQFRNYSDSPERFFDINNTNKELGRKFKRPASLFNIFTNDNFTKYKKTVLNPKVEYCREINMKSSAKENKLQKDVATCYKCKNLKTKSTYERCLYNNHPEENIPVTTEVKRSSFAPIDFFRYRRSNNVGKNRGNHGKSQNPYRFTDEYFSDATYGLPVIYESQEENCDKIVKNSMICMVCKNAKTNSKYEQCSYVKQPYENTYNETDSLGKPQGRISDSKHLAKYSYSTSDYETNNENKDTGSNPLITERSGDRNEDYLKSIFTTNEKQIEPRYFFQREMQNTSSADCKRIEIDSKTCIICKDSKIGGTYEKCFYNYKPSNKLYKYHRSKSFEYPDKISIFNQDLNKSNQASNKLEKKLYYTQSPELMHKNNYSHKLEPVVSTEKFDKISAEAKVANDSGIITQILSGYGSDYTKSEELNNRELLSSNSDPESYEDLVMPILKRTKSSSEHSSENINVDNCKQFQKDSITCTICKDTKTGNDFEHCSYSYEPNDKVFSYTKSSSFGNSREDDKSRDIPYEDEESKSFENLKESSRYIPRQTYKVLTEAKPEDNVKSNEDTIYLHAKEKTDTSLKNLSIKEQPICKKIMRDKITCYQCSDEDGSQQEECFFVTPQNPEKNKFVFHEIKEYQVDPALNNRGHNSSNFTKTVTMNPVEPNISASKNSYVKLQKPDNDYPDEVIDTTIEETKETEPYDYTTETKSKYDTALQLTLPAYMLTNSEHEAAFDELVASNYDQR